MGINKQGTKINDNKKKITGRIMAVIFLLLSKILVTGLMITSWTNEPKGILGFDLLFYSVSNKSSSIGFVAFMRCSAALK